MGDETTDVLSALREQFLYNQWANETLFAALEPKSPIPAGMAHLLGAEVLWLARLRHEPAELAVWPVLTHDEGASWIRTLRERWAIYLDGLTGADLPRAIEYRNSKGEPWSSRVHDVLSHVLLHASYHRGQLASALRSSGVDPPYTDFIHYTRAIRRAHR